MNEPTPGTPAGSSTAVSTTPYGVTLEGGQVDLFKLQSADVTVELISYGATVTHLRTRDRGGRQDDIVLGYDTLAGYLDDKSYFGCIVGRFGNRLAKGQFMLDGQGFQVPVNDKGNSLHGGTEGFNKRVWSGVIVPRGVAFTLVSRDGDMGFPGELTATVRYTLEGAALRIDYSATTTATTVVNLTNHSYFNLAGQASGTVLEQRLLLAADRFTAIDAESIPTGELAPVAGTPFDFRAFAPIGSRLKTGDKQLRQGHGYDHNFVLGGSQAEYTLHLAARVEDPGTGRTMTVETTEPGVQFYSGNFLDGMVAGKGGVRYPQYAAFCLETQHFPDAPNQPHFPSATLRPGKTMRSATVFTFGITR